MLKFQLSNFFFFLYYIAICYCCPALAMQWEENFEKNINKSTISCLEYSSKNSNYQDDEKSLNKYITNLYAHNIKVEQTFFLDEKKVNLTLIPAVGMMPLPSYVPAFITLPSLKDFSISLDLSHKELDLEEINSTIDLAKRNPSLIQLSLKKAKNCPWKIKQQAQCLLGTLTRQNALNRGLVTDFTYNFSSRIPLDVENIIAEGLQKGTSLKTISIAFNEERGEKIIDSIKNNQSIETAGLSFYWRSLNSDEADSLAYFITNSPSLSFLRLEASLDTPLLCKFAEVLKQTPLSLKTLKLGSTIEKKKAHPLSEESVKNFFQALDLNKSLQLLQLNFVFPLTSIQTFAESLKLNNTLKILALPNQSLGDEGITSLAQGLKENTSITEIDLSENNISDAGANIILDMLEVNKTLNTFHLSGNPISNLKKAEINKILDKRKIPVFNFSREISLP